MPTAKNSNINLNELPVDSKPVDSNPVNSKPVDSDPVNSKPVDSDPVNSKPVDSNPVESNPVDIDPSEYEEWLRMVSYDPLLPPGCYLDNSCYQKKPFKTTSEPDKYINAPNSTVPETEVRQKLLVRRKSKVTKNSDNENSSAGSSKMHLKPIGSIGKK